jgi:hypothetical protein
MPVELHGLAEARLPLPAQRPAFLEHLERRVAGTLRIVLVGNRRAEDGQHRVTDELLHEAVVAGDCSGQRLEEAVLKGPHHLGVQSFGQRRESGEVGEEDGDVPPIGLAVVRFRRRTEFGCRGRPGALRRAAVWAEREARFARPAACRAGARQPLTAARTEREAGRNLEVAAGACRHHPQF